ncbi:MAG: TolC family protein, partial [Thermoleophilum sp.]|nr:TolC family protein [Thermoleophilum sp.]
RPWPYTQVDAETFVGLRAPRLWAAGTDAPLAVVDATTEELLASVGRALEAAEASSQSALEANQLGYQVGVRINIDVLNAQSQLYQTKAQLAKARYDVLVGNLRLRQAAGVLKPEDVQAINALLQAR